MISHAEENYLKAVYKLSEKTEDMISTKSISLEMKTSAASVTDMLKRLSEKQYLYYEKYKGVRLSEKGQKLATSLIRRHRLWEVFLLEKLHFAWDEVHEIAEELEHIHSDKLIQRLDAFLGYPKYDPHGGPIPDEEGKFSFRKQILLCDMEIGSQGVLVGVQEDSKPFLQYLDRVKLRLGAKVELKDLFDYDGSINLLVNETDEVVVSSKVSQNLFIKPS